MAAHISPHLGGLHTGFYPEHVRPARHTAHLAERRHELGEFLSDGLPRYSEGTARTISPEWASGIAIAWTQPFDAAAAAVPPQLFAEGSTLYAVSYGPNSNPVTTISAYDVVGHRAERL